MPDQNTNLDFGYIVEGIIEQDPVTDQFAIRTVDPSTGKPFNFDINAALARYKGCEVRLILTPYETINQLQEMAEQGQLGDVQVVDPAKGD